MAHISTAEPVCPSLSGAIVDAAGHTRNLLHTEKVYACVEGPRLGTRAESMFLKLSGGDLVGMTNVPEAFLAREAQLCYSTICVATDYDCWLEDPDQHAAIEGILALYGKNLGRVKAILQRVLEAEGKIGSCHCGEALKYAVVTEEALLGQRQKEILAFLRK